MGLNLGSMKELIWVFKLAPMKDINMAILVDVTALWWFDDCILWVDLNMACIRYQH